MNSRINFSHAQVVIVLLFLFLFCPTRTDATAIIDGRVNINVGANQQLVDIGVEVSEKIVVAGTITSASGDKNIFFARFTPSGNRDIEFGNNGVAIIALSDLDETIYDFEFQPNGRIVAVGSQQVVQGTAIYDFLAFRLNLDGTLDTTFGDNGKVTVNQNQGDRFLTVDVQPDGKIVAVGGTNDSGGQAFIVRFNPNGSRDSSFGVSGIVSYNLGSSPIDRSYPSDVEILPDGKILTGGSLVIDRPDDDEVGFYEIRLLSDGIFDNTFGNQGVLNTTALRSQGYNPSGYDAAVLPNGKLVRVGGSGVYVDNLRFPQNGSRIAIVPFNEKFAVLGGNLGGNLKVYSQNSLIGTAWNVGGSKIAAETNGKFSVLGSDSMTRVRLVTSQGTRLANFNKEDLYQGFPADDKTDFAVYRPSEKTAYILKSDNSVIQRTTRSQASKVFPEFSSFTLPISSGIFREVLINRHAESSTNQGFFDFDRTEGDSAFRFQWGFATDIPFGGDFDGNGTFDVGVFRPSNGVWYGYTNQTVNQQGVFVQWGANGDKPVPADYDFDGRTDYAIYRPSNGTWWILRSSDGGATVVQFGLASDIPVTGDFDGDGNADFSVYRPSEGNWYQLLTTGGFRTINFGLNGDYPVAGDYDGDGRHDVAVFRNGVWYILQSRDGLKIIQWGAAGDIPIAVRYDQ